MTNEPLFVCQNCAVTLCLRCLLSNKSICDQQTKHHYKIRSAQLPLVADTWTAVDDLKLLDEVERFGLGNWGAAAKRLGKMHSGSDSQQHYLQRYCVCFERHIPKQVLGIDGTWLSAAVDLQLGDHINLPTLMTRESTVPSTKLDGYMPLRIDFDVEHNNNAELMVADMEFGSSENVVDRTLKHNILQIYDDRLKQREQRRNYAADHSLVDVVRDDHELFRINKKQRVDDALRCKTVIRDSRRFSDLRDLLIWSEGLSHARCLRDLLGVFA